jgi:hypothetical protein
VGRGEGSRSSAKRIVHCTPFTLHIDICQCTLLNLDSQMMLSTGTAETNNAYDTEYTSEKGPA